MAKPLLHLKNSFFLFSRFKSKSSNTQTDKESLRRLDYESNLLFGESFKKGRRKSRKNLKINFEENSDECVYYDFPSEHVASSDDPLKDSAYVGSNPIPTLEEAQSTHATDENVHSKGSNESGESKKSSVNECTSWFPLFNDAKEEYVSTQIYFINPILKKSFRTFPTVTTILTETMSEKSKMYLNEWKSNQVEELGQDKFDEQQRNQLRSRNVLLKLIKKRLLGVRNEDLDISPEIRGFWQSLDDVFPLFSNLKTMEKIVVHPKLKYKGMIDSIIEFKNKPVLVSWKKSSKIKSSIDSTFDAPVQIAAYLGALNYDDNYPFKVEESLLVMSYEDGSKADIFHLKKENCSLYWKMWLNRLHLYQSKLSKVSEDHTIKMEDFASPSSTSDYFPERTTCFEIPLKSLEKNDSSIVKSYMPEKSEADTLTELSVSPPSTGFNNLAYTTFTEVTTKNHKKKDEEFKFYFPMYNNLKKEFVPGYEYEINPVKQDIYNYYPSVTTILNETKSDSAKFVLERWKNNLIAEMGQDGFDKYQRNLLETGTLLHSLIQKRLTGTPEKELDITPGLEGCWKSLQAVFPLISGINVTEANVVHEELKYKGIIDCIAEFRGKPMLIDWKKSDKVKASIANTYDAPLQIAAYIGATNYDSLYPFKVEEGLLIFSYVDGTKADIFHLNRDSCLKYWNSWLQRLNAYRNMVKANDLRIEY